MTLQLVVIILTYNESIHIERAIKNVSGWADKIIILDSHSEDETVEKAKLHNVEIMYRKFDNYKNQREFAIDHVKNQTQWLLFLDADEYLTDALKAEIKIAINQPDIEGYYLPRRFIFMNKWIKWGGYYPTYLLRLFRPNKASLHGIINEHIKISGKKGHLKNDFVDHNLKSISNWIEKHNCYTTFEAEQLLNFKTNNENSLQAISGQGGRKQWIKHHIWNKFPLVIRPFIYFIYRYFIRLGFLDGKEGFIYHFLQGFWLWLLVDIKYIELKKKKCAE